MYFDTYERDDVQKQVMDFYVQRSIYKMKRVSDAQRVRLLLLIIFHLISVATIVLFQPENTPGWLLLIPLAAFIALNLLSFIWYQKTMGKIADEGSLEEWLREIEDLEVDSEERQLFLQLLDMMQTGTKAEIQALIRKALQSPKLSRLAFLRELHTIFK
jgi:hypothetical protein